MKKEEIGQTNNLSVKLKIFNVKKQIKAVGKQGKSHQYTYSTLSSIKLAIDPLLEAERLLLETDVPELENDVFTFRTIATDIENGAFTEYTFKAKSDTVQKNAIQGTGSTYSYMQRYIMKEIFDLDFVDDDPDHYNNTKPQVPKKWIMDKSKASNLWDKYKTKQPEGIKTEDMQIDYKNWIKDIIGHNEIPKIDENQYNELLEVL